MFIGVSMQLQAVFKYFLSHTVGRLPLEKKKKKKKKKKISIELSCSGSSKAAYQNGRCFRGYIQMLEEHKMKLRRELSGKSIRTSVRGTTLRQ